jgi:hypothetical protein
MGDGSAACCGIAVISVGYGIGCDILIQAPGYTSSINKSFSSSTGRRAAAAAAVAASRWRRGATQSLNLRYSRRKGSDTLVSEPIAMTVARR